MTGLTPSLPFIDDETPISWASRLASFHTGGPVSTFLMDFDVSMMALARGQQDAILRLCVGTGQDPGAVLHNAIVALGGRRFRLRGEEFSAELLTGRDTRFCPLCLNEDRAGQRYPNAYARHRLIWRLSPFRTCRVHNIPLCNYRGGKWNDMIHDLQAITAEPDWWRHLSAQTEARECSPLQCYVERRLSGEKGAEWLDGQNIEQAVRTTEMLGGLLAYGPSQKAKDMTEDMWDKAGRAVWPLVTKGDAEIREFLSRTLLKAVRMNGHPSPRNSFGMLYGWLFSSRLSKDPGPIRDIVREVIIENVPLVPGQMLLGTPVATPRLASIAAIAGTEGLHSKTLRNVLELAGVLDGIQPLKGARNVVADYALAKPLIERAKHTTPVIQVPDMLSASRPMVSALIELGELTRIQDHDALKSKVGKAIDGRSIRQVLCFLDENFEAVKHAPEGHVHLAKAAEKTRVTLKVILELLFGLHLKTVCRLKGHHGFSGVLVSPDEIRACMANPPENVSDEIRFWMG